MKENGKVAGILIFFVLLINLSLIFDVGFISDDWSLLQRAETGSIFSVMEQHHYSPFIAAIFKVTSYFQLSPVWIHLLAFLIHGVNIFLVTVICGRLGMSRGEKWIVSSLFALSPAGFESLAWCCAIGYVLCSTWILLAIRLTVATRDVEIPKYPYRLAFLQLLAFATWDWGILLTPLAVCIKWFYCRHWELKPFYPAVFVWAAVMLGKQLAGFSLGYELNSPLAALKNLGASFMLILWPEFSRSFYESFWGIALGVVSVALFLRLAIKDRISLVGLLLFILATIPVALLSYPQSRYVYLSAFFLYWILARFFHQGTFGKALALIYIVGSLSWTIERRDMWIEADLQAKFFKKTVESANQVYEKLALANVPDQVSGFDRVWLPTVWRCGTECLGSNVLVMNPFGKEPIAETELPEEYHVLKIGDRRKFRSISK